MANNLNAVNNNRIIPLEQPAPVQAASRCSWDKITRIVLKTLSLTAYICTAVALGSFIFGNLAISKAVGYAGLSLIFGKYFGDVGRTTYDFKDPVELAEIKRSSQHLKYSELTARFRLVDIVQYEIVPFEVLQEKIYLAIQVADQNGLDFLRPNAKEFRERNLISNAMYDALIANQPGVDIAAIARRELEGPNLRLPRPVDGRMA